MKSIKISSIAIAVAITATLVTSVSGAQNGMRDTDIWQGVPGVQLTSDQKDRIASIRNELPNRTQSIRKDNNLTREEQDRMIAKAQSEEHERVMAALTAKQRQQMDKLWQARPSAGNAWNGNMPGAGPKMQGHSSLGADIGQGVPGVKLTSDQKNRIASIRNDLRSRIQSIRKDNSLTREEKESMIMEAQREGHERVMASLTLQQRRQSDARWQAGPGNGKAGKIGMRGNGPVGKNKH